MRPPYWKEHQRKIAYKIREGHDPNLQQWFKDLEYCKQINELIKTYNTGKLEQMAKKLKISISRATRLLIFMIESLDCPVEYDALLKTYFYNGDGELRIGFVPTD
jgi:hypothetical protein